MSIGLLFPNLTLSSSKDIIICTLLDETDLTAKQIHSRVSKTKTISYQAVFKYLQQLCDVNTLVKTKNTYAISPDWIKQLKTFTNIFDQRTNISAAGPITESRTIEFNTYYSFIEGILNLFSSRMLIEKDGPNYGVGALRHMYWALNFGDQNFEKLKIMGQKHESYVICNGNTIIDNWLKDYYISAGFKGIKLEANYNLENDFAVVGNYIIQIFFDPETEKRIDYFYRTTKEISTLIQKGFMDDMLTKKVQIKIIVFREPELAKTLRDKILTFFD